MTRQSRPWPALLDKRDSHERSLRRCGCAAAEPRPTHIFEYHYLRRRLLEFHSADQRDIVAIDAVMRKLDEMRGALRATQPPLGARALTHATAHAYR
jgi:hypothetical protein